MGTPMKAARCWLMMALRSPRSVPGPAPKLSLPGMSPPQKIDQRWVPLYPGREKSTKSPSG